MVYITIDTKSCFRKYQEKSQSLVIIGLLTKLIGLTVNHYASVHALRKLCSPRYCLEAKNLFIHF